MGLKANFTQGDIRDAMAQKLKRIEQMILNELQYVGETFVRNARENGSYTDQTGNLRSSIGYIILKDGQDVFENFEEATQGTDKQAGRARGEKFAKELAAKYPNGYALIVVAGMEYAAAVESKGRDVLTASSFQAEDDLRKALQEIKSRIR